MIITDEEVALKLAAVNDAISEAIKHFVGEKMSSETLEKAKHAVKMALIQTDICGMKPYITDLVDVFVEQDTDDHNKLLVTFKRKPKVK